MPETYDLLKLFVACSPDEVLSKTACKHYKLRMVKWIFCNLKMLLQIKIWMYNDLPVQVDGEPWIQSAGQVVVLRSALKVSVIKWLA